MGTTPMCVAPFHPEAFPACSSCSSPGLGGSVATPRRLAAKLECIAILGREHCPHARALAWPSHLCRFAMVRQRHVLLEIGNQLSSAAIPSCNWKFETSALSPILASL